MHFMDESHTWRFNLDQQNICGATSGFTSKSIWNRFSKSGWLSRWV
jgi:hypothetical protein